jgi:CheY-like chemotaxis protein
MSVFDDYTPRFSGYRSLMPFKIQNILLVSSLYDAFVLEEDGSLTEQIWSQYVGMRLTDPPHVRRVSSSLKALKAVESGKYDLMLLMARLSDGDPFSVARHAKQLNPDLPIVLLCTDPAELLIVPPYPERKDIDRVFVWNNDPQALLAIIKLIEDRQNVDHDTRNGQVRVIIMTEDSPAQYSTFLPIMYTAIMQLTRSLIDDGFNDLHKQLRMRSRAKVLLAESYEEGIELYETYKKYVLGVISDVRYWRNGKIDPSAGIDFARTIKEDASDIPIVLQSAEAEVNLAAAKAIGVDFLDKNSPNLLENLQLYLEERMGFGDFIFRMPNQQEVGRAANVYDFMEALKRIPIDSLIWHAQRNHFSNWLMARTEVTMAEKLRPRRVTEFSDPEQVRELIVSVIQETLNDKQRDVVAAFTTRRQTQGVEFMHLGQGSLGGKGRGIAFMRFLLAHHRIKIAFPNVDIQVPKTLVLGAGEFERFLKLNDLRTFAVNCDSLDEIRERFLLGTIAPELYVSLQQYLHGVAHPIAVRSSSILEDSHLQPFAGLYDTFMLPNNMESEEARLGELLTAVKMVWASTFGPDAKAYFRATSNRIEAERMAVVIQEVVGKPHGDLFYPTFSGVAQSYNYYPYGPMEPEDGVAHIALGLGKMVVEGGSVVRFCPRYPQTLPQYASPTDWLNQSQRSFYAISLIPDEIPFWKAGNEGLSLQDKERAEADGELGIIASSYNAQDGVIRDSLSVDGPRILTFAGILKYREFPLADILNELFPLFSEAMGCPVEMEFAVNLHYGKRKDELRLLQLRPLITRAEHQTVEISDEDRRQAWCRANRALGNGVQDSLHDIIYVRPEKFDRRNLRKIAVEVGQLNAKMVEQNRPYILIGFGRWGSSDPWLGIGVGWSQISGARAMIETSLDDFRVDPSNGAHFFQNITSLGIGYLSIPHGKVDSFVDFKWLNSLPEHDGTHYLRQVRTRAPIPMKINGRSGEAVILKPRSPGEIADHQPEIE